MDEQGIAFVKSNVFEIPRRRNSPEQEEFVIENSKEAWDRGEHWQEKACIFSPKEMLLSYNFLAL